MGGVEAGRAPCRLFSFLDIPESSTVKAFVAMNAENQPVALFVPGDHEVNEIKAAVNASFR